jgi:hypothetical protein
MRFTVTREGGTTYTMAVPVYKAGHELLDPESPQGLGSPAPHLSTDGQAELEEEEGLMEEEEVAGGVGGHEGMLQVESKTLEVEVVTDEVGAGLLGFWACGWCTASAAGLRL